MTAITPDRDPGRLRPPPGMAALNLGLGAVFIASIPLSFAAIERAPVAALGLVPWMTFAFATVLFFNYHWLHHEHPHLTWAQLGRHRDRGPRALSLGEAIRGTRPDLGRPLRRRGR